MDTRKILSRITMGVVTFVSVVAMMSAVNSPIVDTVYADIEDDVGETSSYSGSGDDVLGDLANQQVDEDDQGVINWLTGRRNVTAGQLESASKTMRPVTAMFGYVTGGIMVLIVAGVTVITALDLLYIAIPPIRGLLYSGSQGGSGGMMSGGMMGRGMGMSGMGAMGGSTGASQQKQVQWVSDEAIACAGLLNSGGQQMGGMYGGMGAMQGQQQQNSTSSVIGVYFKKRVFFMILLALSLVVLTSSVVMDCGVNLAEWVLKIFGMINGKL